LAEFFTDSFVVCVLLCLQGVPIMLQYLEDLHYSKSGNFSLELRGLELKHVPGRF